MKYLAIFFLLILVGCKASQSSHDYTAPISSEAGYATCSTPKQTTPPDPNPGDGTTIFINDPPKPETKPNESTCENGQCSPIRPTPYRKPLFRRR